MKKLLSTLFTIALISGFSQCDWNVIGNFDGPNYNQWTYYPDQSGTNYGAFSQEGSETYGGANSLKADVTVANTWQMRTLTNCDYAFSDGTIYSISFWAKGTIGHKIKVSIQSNDSGTNELEASTIELTSAEWKEYNVNLTSDGDYAKGRLRFNFQDVGTYYLDEISFEEVTLGTSEFIAPNDDNLRYTGVGYLNATDTKAVFYRFTEEYATTTQATFSPYVQLATNKRSPASGGITIQFKTNSSFITPKFVENTTLTQGLTTLAFAVYKNGEFFQEFISNVDNVEFDIINAGGEMAEWTITMPSYAQMEFLGMDIEKGSSLETLAPDNRPVYVAIGNSITHGIGQTNTSTHRTYAWQVAQEKDYHLYNWGIGGSKIYDGVFDNFTDLNLTPDVVSILWGYNDAAYNTAYVENTSIVYYENLVSNICTNFPDAKVVGILPTYTNSNYAGIDFLRTNQALVLDNLVSNGTCKAENVVYFDGSTVTDASSLSDDVHMNDQGATEIAEAVIQALSTVTVEVKDTLVMRSEYEVSGDEIIDLEDANEGAVTYSIISGNDNNYYAIDGSTGAITVQNEIIDVANAVHTDVLEVSAGATSYEVTVVDVYDYFIQQNPEYTVLEEYQGTVEEPGNPYTPYNNTWGDGSAVNGVDYRMATMVYPENPDSTIFLWDTPSKAADFGGSSVWSYLNIIWGSRYNLRTDVTGFPIRVGDINTLEMDFDFEQLFGTDQVKIALNQFFTEEDYIAPFNENDGDFFMVFDQIGNWVPPYEDELADTLIGGHNYVLLHDSTGTIENVEGYQLRRAIILNDGQYWQGTVDMKAIYNSFTSRGYLSEDLHFPNIQMGIEVTDGWGAIRVNQWQMRLNEAPNPVDVSITSLQNGESVDADSDVSIVVDASSTQAAITKVEFYVDGELVSTDNSAPFSYQLMGISEGTHVVRVVATDASNNVSSSEISIVALDASACLNLLTNGEFETNSNSWEEINNGGSASTTSLSNEGMSGDNALQVDIANAGGIAGDIQIRQTLSLETGKTYYIKFQAKADVAREMKATFQSNGGTHGYANHWIQTVALTTEPQTFEYSYTSTVDDAGNKFKFYLGRNTSTVYIDQVQIGECENIVEELPSVPTNWYVCGECGVDNTLGSNGKSEAEPLNSLEYAVKSAWNPGDTIFVMEGTYQNDGYGDYQQSGGVSGLNNPSVLSISHTDINTSEDAWFVLTNAPGHSPKIEFDGSGGIITHNLSYIDISGLEIEGPNQKITKSEALADRLLHNDYFSGRGLAFWGGVPYPHHIKIHNMKVHDCPNSGLRVNDGDYLEITHNEVYNCTWWSSNAESAVVIAQSKDYDDKDIIKMVMSYNVVYNNRNYIPFYAGGQVGSTPNYGTAQQDFIHDGQGVYITRNNPGSNWQSDEDYTSGWFYFANNVAYGNGINGLVVHLSDRTIVTNNLAFMNGATSPVPANQGGEGRQNAGGITINGSDNVFMYNNISWVRYANDNSYQIYGGSAYTASNNIGINGGSAFQAGEYTDYREDDPAVAGMFVDTLTKDFRPADGSVLIDGGIDHANMPADDIEGSLRDAMPDIGPYEYQGIVTKINEVLSGEGIYPNPTRGIVNFSEVRDFTVTNPAGETVLIGSGVEVDLSDLPSGLYFITTEEGQQSVIKY